VFGYCNELYIRFARELFGTSRGLSLGAWCCVVLSLPVCLTVLWGHPGQGKAQGIDSRSGPPWHLESQTSAWGDAQSKAGSCGRKRTTHWKRVDRYPGASEREWASSNSQDRSLL